MPRFKVAGTHADTGEPFDEIIDAGNSLLAYKRAAARGIEVERVQRMDDAGEWVDMPPVDPPAAPPPTYPTVESAAEPPDGPDAIARRLRYVFLRFAALVFLIVGICTWVVGSVVVIWLMVQVREFGEGFLMLMAAISVFVSGVVWVGMAAAFMVLHDTAMNTWRLRMTERAP